MKFKPKDPYPPATSTQVANDHGISQMYFQAGGAVQVVECLSSKHKALSSNPNTTKKRVFFLSLVNLALLSNKWKIMKEKMMPQNVKMGGDKGHLSSWHSLTLIVAAQPLRLGVFLVCGTFGLSLSSAVWPESHSGSWIFPCGISHILPGPHHVHRLDNEQESLVIFVTVSPKTPSLQLLSKTKMHRPEEILHFIFAHNHPQKISTPFT
jgi:hypothetical protein